MALLRIEPLIVDSAANFVFNSATISANITAGNANLGNLVTANYISGSLTTNSQPNITTIGTLTSLAVSGTANLGSVGNVLISGGTSGYVLGTDGAGNLSWVEQTGGTGGTGTTPGVTTVDTFTGNGSQTAFILTNAPASKDQTVVNYNGAMQLRSAYSLSGRTLTFSEAPANGSTIEVTTTLVASLTDGNLVVRTFVADGTTSNYTVSTQATASSVLVTENGIVQVPITDYTVSTGVLTFVTAPSNGIAIQIRELGVAMVTTPPVGSNTQIYFNDTGSASGSSSLTFDKTTSTLTAGNIVVNGSITPNANVTYDLGSSTKSWKDLYLSGNTIHLGGALISVNDTSGAVLLTPAPTVSNPTPTAQIISSPRYISMVKTGTITTPDVGTSRYYPPKAVTISNVSASLSTAPSSDLQFIIKKNGANTGAYTVTTGSYQLTKTEANISLATTDYLTIDILSGTGAAELRLDLEYTDV